MMIIMNFGSVRWQGTRAGEPSCTCYVSPGILGEIRNDATLRQAACPERAGMYRRSKDVQWPSVPFRFRFRAELLRFFRVMSCCNSMFNTLASSLIEEAAFFGLHPRSCQAAQDVSTWRDPSKPGAAATAKAISTAVRQVQTAELQ